MNCDQEILRNLRLKDLRQMYANLCQEFFGWKYPPKNSFGRWLTESLSFNTIDCLIPDLDYSDNPLYREISEDLPNKIYPLLNTIDNMDRLTSYVTRYLVESRKLTNKYRRTYDVRRIDIIYGQIYNLDIGQMTFSVALGLVKSLTSDMNTEMSKIFLPLVNTLIGRLIEQSASYALEISKVPLISYDIIRSNTKGGINLSYRSQISEYNVQNLTTVFIPTNIYQILLSKHSKSNRTLDMWVLYKRYSSFTEVDKQSVSLQAAIPYKLMKFMNRNFGVDFECFASPLNSYFGRYCSTFIDTDRNFGSEGNFFRFYPTTGSFEANPPFCEFLMKNMVTHIDMLLSNSDEPLSFIVFVPRWEDAEAIIQMKNSRYHTGEVVAKARKHVYRSNDQLREFPAIHETLIFFLQNSAGAIKWPGSQQKIQAMLESFSGN